MIPVPPENKSVPDPREGAPHEGKPARRRRDRPPVRDRHAIEEIARWNAEMRAKIAARKGAKSE